MKKFVLVVFCLVQIMTSNVHAVPGGPPPQPVRLKDEVYSAMHKGNFSKDDYEKLKHGADEDYFRDMDKGITRSENQAYLQQQAQTYLPGIGREEAVQRAVKGRNNWMVFTGGNDRFWDIFNKATIASDEMIQSPI